MAQDEFSCVYYSQQYPRSLRVLTLIGLIFDKVYFPGVWIPNKNIDEKSVAEEANRIQQLLINERKSFRHLNDNIRMIGLMNFIKHAHVLKDFCIFTGQPGCAGTLEEGAKELAFVLEEMLYGPPKQGFTPAPAMGFAKGLPGNRTVENSINGPSWISYPANSVIFSQKHGIPLLNDFPEFPVPFVPSPAKSNAKILSTYLALESIKIILPKISHVEPECLLQIRDDLKDELSSFRLKMVQFSRELNQVISSTSSLKDVQREAKFIAETIVIPELENLKRTINDIGKPWHQRLLNLALDTPMLIGNFSTMLPHKSIQEVFKRIGQEVKEMYDEEIQKNRILIGSGLSYLMKLQEY